MCVCGSLVFKNGRVWHGKYVPAGVRIEKLERCIRRVLSGGESGFS